MSGVSSPVYGSGGGSSFPSSVDYAYIVAKAKVGLDDAITGPTSWAFRMPMGTASADVSTDTQLHGCVYMRAGGILVAKYSDGADACTYTVDGGWLATDELIISLYVGSSTIQVGIVADAFYYWGSVESLVCPYELEGFSSDVINLFHYLAPAESIMYYDAEVCPLNNLINGNPFGHSVTHPQYQKKIDGFSEDVGDKPPVDIIDGEKWLRVSPQIIQCAASPQCQGAAVGVPPIGWGVAAPANGISVTVVGAGNGYADIRISGTSTSASASARFGFIPYTNPLGVVQGDTIFTSLKIQYLSVIAKPVAIRYSLVEYTTAMGELFEQNTVISGEYPDVVDFEALKTVASATCTKITALIRTDNIPVGVSFDVTLRLSNVNVTKTSYKTPFVPITGTVASITATGSTGVWFDNKPESDLNTMLSSAHALTLYMRVKIGISSSILPNSTSINILTPKGSTTSFLYINKNAEGVLTAVITDGVNTATVPLSAWTQGDKLLFFAQVTASGERMRVGYKLPEHGTITWGNTATYDGSFNPDEAISKLMLGYGNNYPVWFNKIIVYGSEVEDADLIIDSNTSLEPPQFPHPWIVNYPSATSFTLANYNGSWLYQSLVKSSDPAQPLWGDGVNNILRKRAQIVPEARTAIGAIKDISFNFVIPSDWVDDSHPVAIAGGHSVNLPAGPWALYVKDNSLNLTISIDNPGGVLNQNGAITDVVNIYTPITKDALHVFRLEMKVTKDTSGYAKAYIDSVLLADYSGPTVSENESGLPYEKFGVYVFGKTADNSWPFTQPYKRLLISF